MTTLQKNISPESLKSDIQAYMNDNGLKDFDFKMQEFYVELNQYLNDYDIAIIECAPPDYEEDYYVVMHYNQTLKKTIIIKEQIRTSFDNLDDITDYFWKIIDESIVIDTLLLTLKK